MNPRRDRQQRVGRCWLLSVTVLAAVALASQTGLAAIVDQPQYGGQFVPDAEATVFFRVSGHFGGQSGKKAVFKASNVLKQCTDGTTKRASFLPEKVGFVTRQRFHERFLFVDPDTLSKFSIEIQGRLQGDGSARGFMIAQDDYTNNQPGVPDCSTGQLRWRANRVDPLSVSN